jgi:hypothetical protein
MNTPHESRDLRRLVAMPACRGSIGSLVHLLSVVAVSALLVRIVLGGRCRA